MSATMSRCFWCGSLTDSVGCLNITCAGAQVARDELITLRARVTALEGTVATLREGLQRIATLTINLNEHGALTMARFASNTLAGRRYCDDGPDPEVAP